MATVNTTTFKHVLSVIFAAIAAAPAVIPSLVGIFNISAVQATEITGIVAAIVTVAAGIHAFLVNQGILTRVAAAFRRN